MVGFFLAAHQIMANPVIAKRAGNAAALSNATELAVAHQLRPTLQVTAIRAIVMDAAEQAL